MKRSALDRGGGAADDGRAGACALRKILSQLAVPGARGFSHRTLGCHPLFNRTPTVITLVGLHLPLHSVPPTIACEWLNNGKYPQAENAGRRTGETSPRALSRVETGGCRQSDTLRPFTDCR